jgi:DNA-binding transcriptional LysR family regulator
MVLPYARLAVMLEVRRLRVLRAAVAHGSFSAAATAMSLTQSAVSQQIAALEREAGASLVVRGARGVRPTQAGEALVRHAHVILARLADAEAEIEAIAGRRGARLRVASFPTAGASIVPQAIARFRALHPEVDVTLVPAEPPQGETRLRDGDADIALLVQTGWQRTPDDGLDRVEFLADPMYVCLPLGHPTAGKAWLELDDLRDDAWLMASADRCPDHAITLNACAAAGFRPRVSFQSDDYSSLQGLVAAGMGIAVVPDLALLTVRDDIVFRAISPRAPVRHIVAATLAGRYRSPATTAMLEILVEVGREFEADRRALALAS